MRTISPVGDYDDLPGPSILKRNLGLQQYRHSSFVGPSDEIDPQILSHCRFNDKDEYILPNGMIIRKVAQDTSFILKPYTDLSVHSLEIEQVDNIERLVAPYGQKLVDLYFRIIHPAFPILHKKYALSSAFERFGANKKSVRAWLEKYSRTHREIEPPLLAVVYVLALNWWSYDRELSVHKKPDADSLVRLAKCTFQDAIHRPKLSVLQAGLLLVQLRSAWEGAWALGSQLVATAQELGIHLDCNEWEIPEWEKGLRRRLAWSVYMLDKTSVFD